MSADSNTNMTLTTNMRRFALAFLGLSFAAVSAMAADDADLVLVRLGSKEVISAKDL